jgi:hypothetical protein
MSNFGHKHMTLLDSDWGVESTKTRWIIGVRLVIQDGED